MVNGLALRDKIDQYCEKTGDDFNNNYQKYEFSNIWDDGSFIFFNAYKGCIDIGPTNCPFDIAFNYILSICKQLKIERVFTQVPEKAVKAYIRMTGAHLSKNGIKGPNDTLWAEVEWEDVPNLEYRGKGVMNVADI